MKPTRTIATRRIVGLVLAVVCVGLAVTCAGSAVRWDASFHEWLEARPMEASIDLSQPGETTVPFSQTCAFAHGEALFLDVMLDDEERTDLEPLFEGLSASLVIVDTDGNVTTDSDIDATTVQDRDGAIMLTYIVPIAFGEYVATVRIDSGAPRLAGRDQKIYAAYLLCGMERLPAVYAGRLAVLFGIIGVGCAVLITPGLLRYGLRRGASGTDG